MPPPGSEATGDTDTEKLELRYSQKPVAVSQDDAAGGRIEVGPFRVRDAGVLGQRRRFGATRQLDLLLGREGGLIIEIQIRLVPRQQVFGRQSRYLILRHGGSQRASVGYHPFEGIG